jgi:hypothetical protein
MFLFSNPLISRAFHYSLFLVSLGVGWLFALLFFWQLEINVWLIYFSVSPSLSLCPIQPIIDVCTPSKSQDLLRGGIFNFPSGLVFLFFAYPLVLNF